MRPLILVANLAVALLFHTAIAGAEEADGSLVTGIQQERNNDLSKAARAYKNEIEQLEQDLGSYAIELIEPLHGLARVSLGIGDYDQAELANQRAQHLSHRHEGVYSPRQLELIDLMTRLYLARQKPMKADQQQHFAYFIAEHNIQAAEVIALLPAINKLGDWYYTTGQFARARRLASQAIEMIVESEGDMSLTQLPYIHKLARLKRLQKSCCSHKVMEDALVILNAHPDAPGDIAATTYVELADAYLNTGKMDEARKYYQLAWQNMNEAQRASHFSAPAPLVMARTIEHLTQRQIFKPNENRMGYSRFRELSMAEEIELESLPPQEFQVTAQTEDFAVRIRDDGSFNEYTTEPALTVVGQPFRFIKKQLDHLLPYSLQAPEGLAGLEVALMFTVDETGSARDIVVLSDDSPGKLLRTLRRSLRKARFRPRLVNGVPVATDDYILVQTFRMPTGQEP